jgi:hypothetical protein
MSFRNLYPENVSRIISKQISNLGSQFEFFELWDILDKRIGSTAVDLEIYGVRIMLVNTLIVLEDLEWRLKIERSYRLPVEHIRCSLNDFRL